jgi:death-on-curing protein
VNIEQIELEDVKNLAFDLAERLMQWDEPIPDFDSRYPNVLESCLQTPFQQFGGKDLYPSFESKAAMLFYLMVKNHPFSNGNKRLAVTTLLVFLELNGRWLEVTSNDLYVFAKKVAESKSEEKDAATQMIQDFIKQSQKNARA